MAFRSGQCNAALLLLVFSLGLLPSCSVSRALDRDQDSAALLMIASHLRISESLESETHLTVHGLMSTRPIGLHAAGKGANEVIGLIELYRKHLDTLETQKDQYTDQQYKYVQTALNEKLSDLETQANALSKRRGRRGFNLFKAIGRGIGNLAKGIGKGVKFVVVEGGKLAIQIVVDKVKTTIRDVFEGRVDSIISRFVTRFGPLSPWAEARLRKVLDRWWLGFRDRVSGRASRYATQTAESLLQMDLEEESQEDEIYEEGNWFDAVWGDIEPKLIEEQKNCQKAAIVQLRSCLLEQQALGVRAQEARTACDPMMEAIPRNDAGGSITMTGLTIFLDSVQNDVSLTYPSAGGEVTGSIMFQRYDDIFGCTYTQRTLDFKGAYDPATCMMQGVVTREKLFEGDVCVSQCGSAPSSPRPCPYKVENTTTWEATLEDGILSGVVGGGSCEEGCFEFRAPGYGTGQE